MGCWKAGTDLSGGGGGEGGFHGMKGCWEAGKSRVLILRQANIRRPFILFFLFLFLPGVLLRLHINGLDLKSAKLNNLNFHPLVVVSRYRDPQLHVAENYSYFFNLRTNICNC